MGPDERAATAQAAKCADICNAYVASARADEDALGIAMGICAMSSTIVGNDAVKQAMLAAYLRELAAELDPDAVGAATQ